jgi:hypothetical protein
MRQAPALGCEHGVLQSPSLVLPETPLQHQYQPVFAVQTVGAPAQTSLAADMKLGTTGTREDLTDPQLRWLRCGMGYGFSATPAAPCAMKPRLSRVGFGLAVAMPNYTCGPARARMKANSTPHSRYWV